MKYRTATILEVGIMMVSTARCCCKDRDRNDAGEDGQVHKKWH